MKLVTIILFGWVAVLFSGCANDTSYVPPAVTNVYGVVVDARTEARLTNATISAAGVTTTTDSTGSYRLLDAPSGEQTLTVSAPNYHSLSVRILLPGGNLQHDVAIYYGPPQFGVFDGSYAVAEFPATGISWQVTALVQDHVALDSVWVIDWDAGTHWPLARVDNTSYYSGAGADSSFGEPLLLLPDSIYARDHDGFLSVAAIRF